LSALIHPPDQQSATVTGRDQLEVDKNSNFRNTTSENADQILVESFFLLLFVGLGRQECVWWWGSTRLISSTSSATLMMEGAGYTA